MFYNKTVSVYKLESVEDEWGAVVEEQYNYQKSLQVDIQPNSREKLNREYGYDLETTKRMFCDIDETITESAIIEYEEDPYEVVKIIRWDDYLDIALNDAVGVDLNGH